MSGGTLRIGAGLLRGRRLRVAPQVRPTEGRVRAALLNIWQHHLHGARFLDLFAGSGAVGLEALSRGAAAVTFVEGAPRVLAALEANRRATAAEPTRVLRLQLPAAPPPVARHGFDLLFADPPYRFDAYEALLQSLTTWAAHAAHLAVEHGASPAPPTNDEALACGWQTTEVRRYGGSYLSFYTSAAAAGDLA